MHRSPAQTRTFRSHHRTRWLQPAGVNLRVLTALSLVLVFIWAFGQPDRVYARPPDVTEAIVDVQVVFNRDCPGGYYAVVDYVDLGQPVDGGGASMNFLFSTKSTNRVYICYKRGPLFNANGTLNAITGITVVAAEDDENARCPAGYTQHPQDLNDTAGGDYIYVCTAKSLSISSDYLLNLAARWYTPSLYRDFGNPWGIAGYEDWTPINVDLNSGAGGNYIFLAYQDTSDVADDRDCGGYLESPCTVDTDFYWQNGSGSCDRGLREWAGECINLNRFQLKNNGIEDEWYVWALNNQRHGIGQDEPLNWMSVLGTHNSFNAKEDGYGLDWNQYYSMSDQLSAGARFLAIDGVYQYGAYRLAHCAGDVPFEDLAANNFGCSPWDRYFYAGIKEINDWLEMPEHAGEVIYILLEDKYPRPSLELNLALRIFGSKLYIEDDRINVLTECHGLNSLAACPAAWVNAEPEHPEGRYRWPTIREMRASGKQVFVMDSSHWQEQLHFDGYVGWIKETGITDLTTNGCLSYQPGVGSNIADYFTRIEEARSNFNLGEDDWAGLLDADEVALSAVCNIAMISLDMIASRAETYFTICEDERADSVDCDTPDDRAQAAVWSWAENQPTGWDSGGPGLNTSAVQLPDGRWTARPPGDLYRFACAKPREGAPLTWGDIPGQEWKVTTGSGTWNQGWLMCHAEFGVDYTFAAPTNGFMNSQLRTAAGSTGSIWMNVFYRPGAGSPSSRQWVLNRRPEPVFTLSPELTAPEGTRVTIDAAGTADPDGDSITYNWDFGDGTSSTDANPGGHVYADNGRYTIILTVTDEHGAFKSSTKIIEITNVSPTTEAGPDVTINEGETAVLDQIAFSDPGTLDTHTVSVNWGEGTTNAATVTESPFGPPGDTNGMQGSAYAEHTYGDNGTYTVEVCTTDDDGDTGCDTLTVTVNNLDPGLVLDKSDGITFAEGDAFLARRSVDIDFDADMHDEGSDDLTLTWRFPPSIINWITTYFNDGANPDPPQSPGPVFPVDIHETITANFDMPGVYSIDLDVLDDDGGTDVDDLPLLVTDNRTCTQEPAFWHQQFTRRGGRVDVDEARLQGYIDVIRFASTYFDDSNLLTLTDAEAVLNPAGGPNASGIDQQMALAAWLNFASGGVRWDEDISLLDAPFYEIAAQFDRDLANGENVNVIVERAEAINALHPGMDCNDVGPADIDNMVLNGGAQQSASTDPGSTLAGAAGSAGGNQAVLFISLAALVVVLGLGAIWGAAHGRDH